MSAQLEVLPEVQSLEDVLRELLLEMSRATELWQFAAAAAVAATALGG